MLIRFEVNVTAEPDAWGVQQPVSFRWHKGIRYVVDRVYDCTPTANPAGGFGLCYKVKVSSDEAGQYDRKGSLWYDIPSDKWYINQKWTGEISVCGRFQISVDLREFLKDWANTHNVWISPEAFEKKIRDGDIVPTDPSPVFVAGNNKIETRVMRWGFERDWSKNPLFNAKGDDIAKTFAKAQRFRCIIPTAGFYETQKAEGKNAGAYLFTNPGNAKVYLAGFWEPHEEYGGCFTVVTTKPNRWVEDIHPRMPIVLLREEYRQWLNPNVDVAEFTDRSEVLLARRKVKG